MWRATWVELLGLPRIEDEKTAFIFVRHQFGDGANRHELMRTANDIARKLNVAESMEKQPPPIDGTCKPG